MRILLNIVRIITGILFIFSGLVKANDPHGLGYKMQEFAEVWTESLRETSFFAKEAFLWLFHQQYEYALALSVIMIAFEIVAGVALLLGWRMKLISWLLLLLIIFFTFLTGYTYYTGKPVNCGCFGDCLPISSGFSFWKDVILLVFIGWIFAKRREIRPVFRPRLNNLLMLISLAISVLLQWYVLRYLPIVDCLPYKKGNNISEKMKMPANAVPDEYDIRFIYEKEGKQFEFSLDELPEDIATYTFVDQKKILVKKGSNNTPPISGFTLTGRSGGDSTSAILDMQRVVLIFAENFSNPPSNWEQPVSELFELATQAELPVFIVTGSMAEAEEALAGTSLNNIPVFTMDFTAIRTAARVNPTMYLLQKGTVKGKWSYARFNKAKEEIPKMALWQSEQTPAGQWQRLR